MKILMLVSSSALDSLIRSGNLGNFSKYDDYISSLNNWGFHNLFGFNYDSKYAENDPHFFNGHKYCILYPNSTILQDLWVREYGNACMQLTQEDILLLQIRLYSPDVIYTTNHSFITPKINDQIKSQKIFLAIWNASPLPKCTLDHFDLGISFSSRFLSQLESLGVNKTTRRTFFAKPIINAGVEGQSFFTNDIVFVGTLSVLFKKRNKSLIKIYNSFKNKYKISYFFSPPSIKRRLLRPNLSVEMLLRTSHGPVFLSQYLDTISRSRIILNFHSDSTGVEKGNMRLYETLSAKSLLLTDAGSYPHPFKPNQDFMTFQSHEECISKIKYALSHESECKKISNNGFSTIDKHFNSINGYEKLASLFSGV